MFLLLNWLNELNIKKANEKICSKVGGILDQSLIDLQEEKSNLFRDCLCIYFKLTVVNHYFVAEINGLYSLPYIASQEYC